MAPRVAALRGGFTRTSVRNNTLGSLTAEAAAGAGGRPHMVLSQVGSYESCRAMWEERRREDRRRALVFDVSGALAVADQRPAPAGIARGNGRERPYARTGVLCEA